MARFFQALVFSAAVALGIGPAYGQGSISGLQDATVPLTIGDEMMIEQGAGCLGRTAPCTTLRVPSLRVGQPVQTNCSTISTPFTYQQCIDTSTSLPTLKEYFAGGFRVIGTLDTGAGIWTPPVGGGLGTIGAAGTTDLGTVPQASVSVTGAASITSFGSSAVAGTLKFVTFVGVSTLTYNGTSMILPGGVNIVTAAGDVAVAQYLGSGNWKVISYTYSAGQQISAPLVVTDNKTGVYTTDGAAITALSKPGITAMDVAEITCDGCGYRNYDAIRGVSVANSGNDVINTTGVAGYVRNQQATGPGGLSRNAVSAMGFITCEVNDSACWGLNTVVMDSNNYTIGVGTGRSIAGYESDFIVVNPDTIVFGIYLIGNSLSQPSAANGFTCNPLSDPFGVTPTPMTWDACLISTEGASLFGLSIGALARSGTGVSSQGMLWGYWDSSSLKQNARMYVQGADPAAMILDTLSGAPISFYASGDLWLINSVTSGANVDSKTILMRYRDGTATAQDASLKVEAGTPNIFTLASLSGQALDYSISGNFRMPGTGGKSITMNAKNVVALDGSDNELIGADATLNSIVIGNTAPVFLNGIPTSAAGKQFVCIDAVTKELSRGTAASCN